MTETQWLASADSWPMVRVALTSPRASDRTCRLCVAAIREWKLRRPRKPPQRRKRFWLGIVADLEGWADTGTVSEAIRAQQALGNAFLVNDAREALTSEIVAVNHAPDEQPEIRSAEAGFLREVFGNPFRSAAFSRAWRTDTAVSLARQMYESRDFSAMPILADSLQDAGCDSDDILAHCRGPGSHVRGCWVVDLVLGKE